ncbi:PEP-CTERM sorting domain-containing protein [Herbaspirillum frisingense]|uniref:PEP-CTERM sorting domain-containing protein n=1 Tax=Herbaspirillum frisingense TaxID=92645 RepID=UPI001603808E|nr:PEP-CTERM sorting domain-containing protein [Herbaspirillum frisingense]QNB09255.1 PEP-CTERM sorting domain-containing protein [Herbaspirillum frisingense]
MNALSVLAVAPSLVASSISSHAEVITFSGSGDLNYGDFKGGQLISDADWSLASLFSNLSPLTYSNGALNINMSYNMFTGSRVNSLVSIVSKNQQYVINGFTYQATIDNPAGSLQVFRANSDPRYQGSYQVESFLNQTNQPTIINFSTPPNSIFFRTADLNFAHIPSGGNVDGTVNVALKITSLDVTRVSPVPEPNTALMMMSAIGIMGFAARRRRKKLIA